MIRWFARNSMAANFLAIAILLLGIYAAYNRIPLEVRPSIELREVIVRAEYRGATPQDIEETLTIPIEKALEGMPGMAGIWSQSWPGSTDVHVYPSENSIDLKELAAEIERRVSGVRLPNDVERPTVRIPNSDSWWEVLSVAVSGNLSEEELFRASRRVRDDLISLPEISQAKVIGAVDPEIAIEADSTRLADYGLSLSDVSNAIRRSSLDLPAGEIRSDSGTLMLRTKGQAYVREDFEQILLTANNGAEVRLGEVAKVSDGFEERRKIIRFNDKPALFVEVLRTGDESAIEIANRTRQYVEESKDRLPPGVELTVWDDDSISLRGRLGTLSSSLIQGCILVLLVLSLFLRPTVAFWVVIGIPISFAGGLLAMWYFENTINLMSLFGFIIVLGIVVDDAIVTGENIYTKLQEGLKPVDAAVLGTKEVATPVTFGILTTIAAFIPLMYFTGWWGNFTKQIPPVVAPVLIFSLIESKLILPCHLKNIKIGRKELKGFAKFQQKIAHSLERFVEKVYRPALLFSLNNRYTSLALFLAMGMACLGLIQGGHLGFVNMPSIDRYKITARLKMADNTPFSITDEKTLQITEAAKQLQKEFIDPGTGTSLVTNIMSSTGGWPSRGNVSDNQGIASIEILPPTFRSEPGPKNEEISKRWRELVGKIPGSQQLSIWAQRGSRHGGGAMEAMEVEIRGPMSEEKELAVNDIRDMLRNYEGIESAWTNMNSGRDELQIRMRPSAVELGITQSQLARQVRQAFFGEEVQRVQRNRDNIRVMIRLPKEQRKSMSTLDNLKIRTTDGTEVPFKTVATARMGKAPNRIERTDGEQVVKINASPENAEIDIVAISEVLAPRISQRLAQTDGLTWRYRGYVAEHEDTYKRLWLSSLGLLFVLYALLAIPFKSLIQPIFVLLAIPFGIIGALLGHMLLDITPSYLSVFGILALAGVVVNDSLVMVDFINKKRLNKEDLLTAVLDSGARRFRPILLTSLTTFAGLLPLIFERSIQAQFLIPMAVSLAFGILFATAITLFLIPCAYMASEDLKNYTSRLLDWYKKPFSSTSTSGATSSH